MYDLYDTVTADLHAGGPRHDLDDVVVEYPSTIEPLYATPDDGDILGMFADLARQAEQQWLFDKFYETSEARGAVEEFARYVSPPPWGLEGSGGV